MAGPGGVEPPQAVLETAALPLRHGPRRKITPEIWYFLLFLICSACGFAFSDFCLGVLSVFFAPRAKLHQNQLT